VSAGGDETPAKRWYYPDRVLREIAKCGLSAWEAAKLDDLLERGATGKLLPNDHKKIDDVVHELRLKGHKRIFRIYFAKVEGTLILLLLHFKNKKIDHDKDGIELAHQRFADLEQEARDQAS